MDEFEFLESLPAAILFAPLFGRHGEPDRESFREVFVGMRLRVPVGKMADEAAAIGAGLVGFRRILGLGTAEDLAPVVARGEAIGVIDGVTTLMTQELLAPLRRAAFDLQHLAELESFQTRVSQIKRNRNGGDAGPREPLLAAIAGLPEGDAPRR